MRWALLGLTLLVAVAGLLFLGGVAFMSSLSDAMASRGVDGPGTVAATTVQVAAFTRPDRGQPADQTSVSGMPRSEPSPGAQPAVVSNPEDTTSIATEQRVFQSRKALETVDPREFLRHGAMPK